MFERLYESGEALVATAASQTNSATADVENATAVALYLLLVLNLVAIVAVAIIVRRFVMREIAFRVDTVADRMESMAEGNLDIDIPIEGKDEIASMAEALEVFRQKSREALRLDEVEHLNAELALTHDQLETINEELKTAQEQIVRRGKLAALGQLTAGVAHEIESPLRHMTDFVERSQGLVDELFTALAGDSNSRNEAAVQTLKTKLAEILVRIHEHGERASTVVGDMVAMGSESSEWAPTNLNRILIDHANLAQHSTRAAYPNFQLEIVLELDEELPEVDALPNDIARVFHHMFMNSCYATHLQQSDLGSRRDVPPNVNASIEIGRR